MDIIENRKQEFYKFCMKNEKFFNNINLPKLYFNLDKEAILIEFRILNHLGFLIKNNIYKLGSDWSFTIICGNLNYDYISFIVKNINRDIKIIKKNITNLTRLEYSIMLMNSEFWDNFTGKYLLIYQEDSIIFNKFNDKFLKYYYIGAPFFNKDIGNGGFSFRNKNIMIKICKDFFDKQKEYYKNIVSFLKNKNTKIYKYHLLEKNIIEDLQFSNILKKYYNNYLPNFKEATDFSIEKYYNPNSFGGHQFWYCVNNMEKFLNIKIIKY